MQRRILLKLGFVSFAGALLEACSSDPEQDGNQALQQCTPGMVAACALVNCQGTSTCNADGTVGPCICDPGATANATSATGTPTSASMSSSGTTTTGTSTATSNSASMGSASTTGSASSGMGGSGTTGGDMTSAGGSTAAGGGTSMGASGTSAGGTGMGGATNSMGSTGGAMCTDASLMHTSNNPHDHLPLEGGDQMQLSMLINEGGGMLTWSGGDMHSHTITLSMEEAMTLASGGMVTGKTTDPDATGHSHTYTISCA